MPNPTPWTYAHNAALNMRYAYRQTPGGLEIMTEDKTRYTPEEVRILAGADGRGQITPEIHRVKRVFSLPGAPAVIVADRWRR